MSFRGLRFAGAGLVALGLALGLTQGSASAATSTKPIVRQANSAIWASVDASGGQVSPRDVSCTTNPAAVTAQSTVYGFYYSWSQSTTCDSTIYMGNLSVLQSNGATVSSGSDPMGALTSTIASSGAFGPGGAGPYTLIYQVALSLPTGTWGNASSNCTGVGTANLYCTDYLTVTG